MSEAEGASVPIGLPPDDAQRRVLHDEVHARPPARLAPPERVTHLALRVGPDARALEAARIAELALHLGARPPGPEASYAWLERGDLRVKWERHTEFTSLTFFRHVGAAALPGATALDVVPRGFLASLPARTVVAMHVELRRADPDEGAQVLASFGDTGVVGARIGGGAASVYTDFRIGADGFSRIVVLDHNLGERQAGRYVQRLCEVETYRMMALLAFPIARAVAPALTEAEARLAHIIERMTDPGDADEARLLDDLTRVAAEVERGAAQGRFRFGAAAAYDGLVRQRIAELREERLPGVQTIAEFMERRLAPAMATCASVARRQDELSARIARASQLLRTRVDVALERQNQALLVSMDRRAKLQLRLQQTVEGLSIAAITYYGAGLVGYVAKAAKSLGASRLEPEAAAGLAVPLIAFALWRGLKRLRRRLGHD